MNYLTRLKELEHDQIWEALEGSEPCKDKTVYSSSFLSEYGDCSWKAKLHYLDAVREETRNIKGFRGTVLHHCAKRLHTERKWNDWLDLYTSEWNRMIEDPDHGADLPWSSEMDEKEYTGVLNDGASMLGQYVIKNREANLLGIEVPFRVIFEHPRTGTKYRFAGTIDQLREVDWKGGLLDNYDLKSGQQAPNPAYLARNIQFGSYALGMLNGVVVLDGQPIALKRTPRRSVWYHLQYLLPYKKGGKVQSTGKTYKAGDLKGDPEIEIPVDVDQSLIALIGMMRAIRMKMFFPQPSQVKCQWCRYTHACMTGEGKQQQLKDLLSMSDMGDLE